MSVPFFAVPTTPLAVLDAFDAIDRLDRLAETKLTDRERTCWQMMQESKSADEIAAALDCSPRWARELRVRVQKKLNEAATDEKEGKFRVAVTVAHGAKAQFQEDTTARVALENVSRQEFKRELRDAA